MAVLTLSPIDRSGTVSAVPSAAASAGGDTMQNGGNEFLLIKNASGASITVTAAITKTLDGVSAPGKQCVVEAGGTEAFGPFPPSLYNDSTNNVSFSYSAVASITVKAMQMIPASNT